MNKFKNKGFTLIELLAVIVILAVIALISVPLVMNIIETAEKNSFKASAYGMVEAAELYYMDKIVKINKKEEVTLSLIDGTIKYKGSVPETGTVTIKPDGVVNLVMTKGNWCVKYENSEATLLEKLENDVECKVSGDSNPDDPNKDDSTVTKFNVKTFTVNGSFEFKSGITYFVTAIAAGGNGGDGGKGGQGGEDGYAGGGGIGGRAGQLIKKIPFSVDSDETVNITVGQDDTIIGSYIKLIKGEGKMPDDIPLPVALNSFIEGRKGANGASGLGSGGIGGVGNRTRENGAPGQNAQNLSYGSGGGGGQGGGSCGLNGTPRTTEGGIGGKGAFGIVIIEW